LSFPRAATTASSSPQDNGRAAQPFHGIASPAIPIAGPEHDAIKLNRLTLFSLFEHDLFGKPVSTSPDHALNRLNL